MDVKWRVDDFKRGDHGTGDGNGWRSFFGEFSDLIDHEPLHAAEADILILQVIGNAREHRFRTDGLPATTIPNRLCRDSAHFDF